MQRVRMCFYGNATMSWPRKIGPEKYSQFDKIGIAKDFGFKEGKKYGKEDKDRRYN